MTTKQERDTADLGIDAPNGGDGEDDATVSIDWESEENPYKKKFSGEQSRSARLESELEAERSDRASLTQVVNRLDVIEDLVADVADRGGVRAGRDELDFDDDGIDDDSPRTTTGKAREKIQESRQAEAKRAANAQAQKVYDRLQEGWIERMSPASDEMQEVTRLYNEALEDPAKVGQLNTALTLFNAYRKSVTSAAAASPPPATPSAGEGDGDEGDEVAEDVEDDNEILEDDGSDDKMTARQRNARNNASQGQEGQGSTPARDFSNLSPQDKFRLHEEGKTPATY